MSTKKYDISENSSRPLLEQAADKIIELIIDRNLNAGDRIPTENELAELLNVGRSTIREAIRALSTRNILEVKRGSGTFVCENCGVAEDPLGFTFVKDKFKLVHDLFEIRYIIEPKIAAMAAQRANSEQIDEIEKLCNEVEAKILADEPHGQKDIEFHTAIAKSCGNMAMVTIIPIINQSIMLFIDITNSQIKKETIETHREILEAIKSHDANAAHDAMVLHMIYNRRNINSKINCKHNAV